MKSHTILFPTEEYWWFYIAFVVGVLILISIDLGLFKKHEKSISLRQATFRTATWVSLALMFNVLLYFYAHSAFSSNPRLLAIEGFDPDAAAWQVALEFLTGYVIEQSLSIDNIFVFVVVFMYFRIPPAYQHRVLFYGILGALVLRGIFIALGSMLIEYEFVIWIFGAFLIYTGLHMVFGKEREIHPEKNFVIRNLKKLFPVTADISDDSFFKRIGGRLHITPLFIALIFLELTDIVFAVDSVPAIFAITREPLIVFTSNIFAILGLRSLYFLLAGVLDLFYLLKYGLALVLVFVGNKMIWLNEYFGGKFPSGLSLAIILTLLGGSILLSLLFPKKKEIEKPAE
ncbi:MAG: TerC/Alx family metal homeostasis membrane protein [Deltaproteobacteria bacterium]|nr:TerC/Alx family metal homeostasis membrane protein [Deltaproteobacteria bacterium]